MQIQGPSRHLRESFSFARPSHQSILLRSYDTQYTCLDFSRFFYLFICRFSRHSSSLLQLVSHDPPTINRCPTSSSCQSSNIQGDACVAFNLKSVLLLSLSCPPTLNGFVAFKANVSSEAASVSSLFPVK